MSKIIKTNIVNGEQTFLSMEDFKKDYKSLLEDTYVDYIKQNSRNPLSCDTYKEIAYDMDMQDLLQGSELQIGDYRYIKE